MGGSSTRKPLGSFGDDVSKKAKTTVVGQIADMGVRASTGGAVSLSGDKGFLQGAPMDRAVAGGVTGTTSDYIYGMQDARTAAKQAAKDAEAQAVAEQTRLANAAKQKAKDEEAVKQAGENLAYRRQRQLRKRSSMLSIAGGSQELSSSIAGSGEVIGG